MNRAFVSLYVLLVLSIVTIGWGLDKLWESYSPADAVGAHRRDLMHMLQIRFQAEAATDISEVAARLDAELAGDLTTYPLDALAGSSLGDRIAAGELVQVNTRGGTEILYQRIPGTEEFLALEQPAQPGGRGDIMRQVLLAAFYLGIAAVVFVWVWPLARDLRRLEQHTREIGRDGEVGELPVLRGGSPVVHLSLAFRRMAERIRDLLTSHKEMTYAVSHELRTPLARMKFALEMAESGDDLARVRERILSAREDVGVMEILINELLAYAAFEQQAHELNCQPGDLPAMINGVIRRLPAQACDVTLDDRLGGRAVVCEWHLLEVAVTNLLQNACRFARGNVVVTLAVESEAFVVRVEDDGPGVPRDARERVFHSFVRLSCKHNSQGGGFGLGLAIVRRVLMWHGGTASVVDSALGGACFELRWPTQAPGLCVE